MNFKVGARGSKLSLAQTNWVISELQKIDPSLSFEIKPITTKGDTDTRPLFAMEQKGIFEKEIDRAVFEKEIDFAVHSLKDVPSKLDPDLIISCVPKREAINDVLITKEGFDRLISYTDLKLVEHYRGNWKEVSGIFFQDIMVLKKN